MKHSQRYLFYLVVIAGIFIGDLFFSTPRTTQPVQAATSLELTSYAPVTNAVGVANNTLISATFNSNLAAGSVHGASFVAHTQFGGLLNGTLSTVSNTITMTPSRPLFAGEKVQVVATAGIQNMDGLNLTNPTQWGFTAGPINPRPFATFNEITTGLAGVKFGNSAWGDYDNDGDLDILLGGTRSDGYPIISVYRNDAGIFVLQQDLQLLFYGDVAWGDYDNDGDLDILMSGYEYYDNVPRTYVYKNSFGTFYDIQAGLVGVDTSSVDWGDYDNDGDLDILLAGYGGGALYYAKIYRNDAGIFSDIQAGLTGFNERTIAWGDYDNDGDLDILGGYSIYRNDAGIFTDIGAVAVGGRSADWGDYDNDGDLDILGDGVVYRNDAGIFTDIGAGITEVYRGSVAWGDYDNDGDLDILIAGQSTGFVGIAKVYRNDAGIFTDIGAGLTGVKLASVAWGDYDNDGDLDILLTGEDSGGNPISKIYRNSNPLFSLIAHDPITNAVGVAVDSTITATFDANLDLSSVVNTSFVAHTKFGGLLTGVLSAVGDTITLNPNRPLFTGEQVQIIATTDIRNADGYTLPTPIQWGFTAGLIKTRSAITFTDAGIGLTGVYSSGVGWGDYDNDGDLDILLTGADGGGSPVSTLYGNNAGIFADSGAGLTDVYSSGVDWGDYDNDGDLDILLTGADSGGNPVAKVYRNDAGIFADIVAGLTGVTDGSGAWGDYDNDGDLDILLAGSGIATVYENNAGIFSNIGAGLTGVTNVSGAWGDYDNDGDLDILLAGSGIATVYENNAGIFSDIGAGLAGVTNGSGAWGDFDNDGDLDILLAGSGVTTVYGNNAGIFTDIGAGLAGVTNGSVAWGDYDNDGDLDILLAGKDSGGSPVANIYRNHDVLFNLIAHNPLANAIGVAVDTNITATFDAELALASVVSTSFVAHTQFSGLLTGTLTAINDTITLYPDRDLFMGEQVQVIATGDIQGGIEATLSATQWGFTAGSKTARCVSAFTDIGAGLAGVGYSDIAWGDYDNDGDLDILLAGIDSPSTGLSKVYRNDAGTFADIGAGLADVQYGRVAWGDYDNDGDLDILLGGYDITFTPITKVYRNDAGIFSDIGAGLIGNYENSLTWGDYDNDGDLDILLGGIIYQNNAGIFTYITEAGLTWVYNGSSAWGDYDNDGDLDVLLTGYGYEGGTYILISRVYRNDAGIFSDIGAGLPGVYYSDVDWGDYDNDGDLDILLMGNAGIDGYVTAVYNNNAGIFTDSGAGLTAVNSGRVAWGDYDNDGDLDILATGQQGGGQPSTKIYRNDAGIFTDSGAGLTDVATGSTTWGDYDNDGDLDVLLTGYGNNSTRVSKVYRNDNCVLAVDMALSGNNVLLNWNDLPAGCVYDIYQQNMPYVAPTVATYPNQSSGILLPTNSDPAQNLYYVVTASCNGVMVTSNEIAVFDFGIEPGN